MILTGGTEAPITSIATAGFASLKALSGRNNDPEHASRPFDAGRDGFVIGEGAGVLVFGGVRTCKGPRSSHLCRSKRIWHHL